MQQQLRAEGFACPECSNRIHVNYFEMISTGKVSCQICGLELHLDKGKSEKALQAVDTAMQGIDEAKAHAEQGNYQQESSSGKRSRGKSRQPRQGRLKRR